MWDRCYGSNTMLWQTQRKDRRFHIAAPVCLRGIDRDGNRFDIDAWTLDVSAGGACIQVPPDVELPRRMQVVSQDYQFNADAEVFVVWEQAQPIRRIGVYVMPSSRPPIWEVR